MRQQRILYCVLDWGLGHATRSLPVIRYLVSLGHEVLVASSGSALRLLEAELPQTRMLSLPEYNPSYTRRGMFLPFSMSIQGVHFLRTIQKEHAAVSGFVAQYQIDRIISDNRYGCHHLGVPSVFVGHQLSIPGVIYRPVNLFLRRFMRKFNERWVPDLEGSVWSGQLSNSHNLKVTYIGLLSALSPVSRQDNPPWDLVALLSGPEPQRSLFEDLVIQQLGSLPWRSLVIGGRPGSTKRTEDSGTITYQPYLSGHELAAAIAGAAFVLARPGYSTVMDLATLGGKAVFVPTPGQPEQTYLAHYLASRHIAPFVRQEELQLLKMQALLKSHTGFVPDLSSSQHFMSVVRQWLAD